MFRLLLHKSPIIKHFTTTSSSSASLTSIDPSSSLTLHFLKNSCGLSPETALSISEKLHLKTTKNPHSVLNFLKSYNFTKPDIVKLIARRPKLLLADPEKTLKPKFKFFEYIGFSGPNLVNLITSVPSLLQFSLPNRLQPNFNLLKTILHTDENVYSAIRRCSSLLITDLDKILIPEIKALEEYGLPMNVILKLLTMHSKSLVGSPNRFGEIFEMVKKIGISPSSPIFAHAFGVLGKLPEREWMKKVENFKRLGWSEEEVMVAFAKHPYCMSASMEKVLKNMEFFREKFGWDSAYVSKNSVALSFSFERRILPRYRILRILGDKGLVNGKIGSRQMMLGEKEFLEKYVMKYHEQVPELIDNGIRCRIEELGLLMGINQRQNVASDAIDS